jgi:hypothetical protein
MRVKEKSESGPDTFGVKGDRAVPRQSICQQKHYLLVRQWLSDSHGCHPRRLGVGMFSGANRAPTEARGHGTRQFAVDAPVEAGCAFRLLTGFRPVDRLAHQLAKRRISRPGFADPIVAQNGLVLDLDDRAVVSLATSEVEAHRVVSTAADSTERNQSRRQQGVNQDWIAEDRARESVQRRPRRIAEKHCRLEMHLQPPIAQHEPLVQGGKGSGDLPVKGFELIAIGSDRRRTPAIHALLFGGGEFRRWRLARQAHQIVEPPERGDKACEQFILAGTARTFGSSHGAIAFSWEAKTQNSTAWPEFAAR